ncbi:hypothetical protein IKW73_02845 [Candidatus Saccharibacteria bacterium]|nr:hypothetical protein [Candidatus Saccharibacteria bacterium]
MDNYQMPQVAPVQPAVPTQPMAGPAPAVPEVPVQKDHSDLIKLIAIIALSLVAVTFIGLFIWMFLQYNEVSTDVNGQIDEAVAAAKMEQAEKDEAEFLEREKEPNRTFSGPIDYGQLTFSYPKTWSLYVAADASRGGDFNAYFNPIQVNEVSNDTINALRVIIRTRSFEDVTADYQNYMDRNGDLTMTSITFNGITANKYTGSIPNSELNGIIVVFKIRDKAAILQTDSVLFEEDFNKVLETVQFNA